MAFQERLFHRRLEIVGFTDAKIEQFIQAFLVQTPEKTLELQTQLVRRADVSALMHIPLLATLMCRLFQLDMALQNIQTGVYPSFCPGHVSPVTAGEQTRKLKKHPG